MIFKNILNIRYRLEFKLLAFVLVTSLILSISGCATTETHRVKAENLDYKMNYELISVIMKNGLIIDLRGIPVHYVKEYKDKKNVIVYETTDTVRISEDSLNVSFITKIIEIDEIKEVTIEKTEIDVGRTILITLTVISALLVIFIIIAVVAFAQIWGNGGK